jgi:hypothetical protein
MVTRSLRRRVGLAATLTLGGCHFGTDPMAEQQSALDRAEAQWFDAAIRNYSYDIGSVSAWFQDSLRIEVRNDSVLSATVLRGNIAAHAFAETVPGLFAAIRQGLASGSDVRVSYDRTLGYPTHIDIPDPPGRVDGAWSANIGNLQMLPPLR